MTAMLLLALAVAAVVVTLQADRIGHLEDEIRELRRRRHEHSA